MRHTFKKHERLHGKVTIDSLFLHGNSFFLYPFVFYHQNVPTTDVSPICTVLFSVSKRKISHATQRNLVRRRMREAFRKNKHLFYSKITTLTTNNLHLAFVYVSNEVLKYATIEKKMVEGVEQITSNYVLSS